MDVLDVTPALESAIDHGGTLLIEDITCEHVGAVRSESRACAAPWPLLAPVMSATLSRSRSFI
jgi:hypothetical protein